METPIDVAPALYVPSDATSEIARGVAAGGGAAFVLWGNDGAAIVYSADLGAERARLGGFPATGGVVFDGQDFLVAGAVGAPGSKVSAQLRRAAPDGTLTDKDLVQATDVQDGTVSGTSKVACRAIGKCLMTYAFQGTGDGLNTGYDVWVRTVEDGVFGPATRVTSAAKDQVSPHVVWNGQDYVVVWMDLRFATGGGSSVTNYQLYGARVNADGVVIDTNGGALTTYADMSDSTFDSKPPTSFGLARAGTGIGMNLVWRMATSGKLRARRIDPGLTPVEAAPVELGVGQNSWAEELALLSNGENYTLVFGRDASSGGGTSATNVSVLTLDPQNKLVGSAQPFGSRFAKGIFATLAEDGSLIAAETVLKSTDPKPAIDATTDAYLVRADGTGKVLASVYTSKAMTTSSGRAFASTAGATFIVYADNRSSSDQKFAAREVFATVLATDGSLHPPAGVKLDDADDRTLIAAAAGASRAVLAYEVPSGASTDVVGKLIDENGNVIKSLVFGGNPYPESSPLVAFDGTDFVVSWTDSALGFSAGVVRRLHPDGTFVDAAAVPVAPGDTSNTTVSHLVCDAGGSCLLGIGDSPSVLYPFQKGVVGAKKLAYEVPVGTTDGAVFAGGGTGFAALGKSGKTYADVAMSRISPEFTTTDVPMVDVYASKSVSELVPRRKAVGWNGARFLASWQNNKGVYLSTLDAVGGPSGAVTVSSEGVYSVSTIGENATKNLLVGGAGDHSLVLHQLNGRIVVTGVTDADSQPSGGAGGAGGTGGTGGAGGSEAAGTGGSDAAGAGGSSSGAGGNGGSGGSGGSSTGKGGSGGTGGSSAGKGGSGGTSSGKGGSSSGKGGTGGGSSGKGGSGAGASSGQAGSTGGATASVNPTDTSTDEGGCGCRVAGSGDSPEGAVPLTLLGALFAATGLRRRSRRQRSR